VTVAGGVGRWAFKQVSVQRVMLGCALGCEPELGGDRHPGDQGQLLAVAWASHGLTGPCRPADGAGPPPAAGCVPQLAVYQGQAQHSAEQHYRSDQVQLGGRDQSGGYQFAGG